VFHCGNRDGDGFHDLAKAPRRVARCMVPDRSMEIDFCPSIFIIFYTSRLTRKGDVRVRPSRSHCAADAPSSFVNAVNDSVNFHNGGVFTAAICVAVFSSGLVCHILPSDLASLSPRVQLLELLPFQTQILGHVCFINFKRCSSVYLRNCRLSFVASCD